LTNRLRELINKQKEIEISPAKKRELTAKKTAIDDRLDSSIDKTIKRLALIRPLNRQTTHKIMQQKL
jgi:hypothetical protein